MATKKTSIGGQALMEGIMMRGPKKTAMAVRNPKGEIILEDWENSDKVPKICKLPIIRGLYGMITSFLVGYKCLMRSAEIAIDGLEEEEKQADAQKQASEKTPEQTEATPSAEAAVKDEQPEEESKKSTDAKSDKDDQKEKENAFFNVAMVIASVIGVVLMLALFIYLPTLLYDLTLQKVFKLEGYFDNVVRSLFEGIIKIALLVAYMLLVSLMKDIRRTFMYHGAEHKTIFCYEQGLELTVENVRPMRRFHPRCGTSFLILMLLVSIVIGSFIPFTGLLRTVCKILLLPLTVGIGYELIKLAGRHDNLFTRIISAPGVWLQHITTKEPTDDMIECAIAAMNKVIPENSEDDNW